MSLSRASRLAISAALGTGMALTTMLPAGADTTESLVWRGGGNGGFFYYSEGKESVTLDASPAGKLLVSVHSTVPVRPANGSCVLSYRIYDDYLFECGTVSTRLAVDVNLGQGDDTLRWNVPIEGRVLGGAGYDTFLPAPGFRGHTAANSVHLLGGSEADTVDYRHSITGVLASLDDRNNDGRRFIDTDRIGVDIENLTGSRYKDSLQGNSGRNTLVGGAGPDELFTLGSNDAISAADGYTDRIICPESSRKVTFHDIDPDDEWDGCDPIGG